MAAKSASQSRAADSTSVSSTVCRSKVERLMTLSTSAVAVCCCSDSRSSLSSRVFSMAMTACAAKFVTSAICLSVNGRTSGPVDDDRTDQLVVLEHRHGDGGSRTPEPSRGAGAWFRRVIDGAGHFPGVDDAAEQALIRFRSKRPALLLEFDQCGRGADAGGAVHAPALAAKQRAVPGLADPHSVFQHGLEHRLELARRAADDAKHFGGRGLLLEQFTQSR